MCECCDCGADGVAGVIVGADEHARRAAAWREAGHRIAWLFVDKRRSDLNDELHRISDALREDEPIEADAVRAVREELDNVHWVLEEMVAPMTEGVEEWGAGASSKTPHGVMAEHLEKHGYDVTRPGERRNETEIEV